MNTEQLVDEVIIEQTIKKILIFNQPESFWLEIKKKANKWKKKK